LTLWSAALVLAAVVRTLVLPFESQSPDPAQAWLGSAFEEAVSSHLEAAGLDVVDLVSRNRKLEESGFTPAEPLTRASAIVIAKDLGAERLIAGEIRPQASGIEVTARLIDLTRGATLGVVDDFGDPRKLSRFANQIAKNLFRLERDQAPPGFDEEAERRAKIPPAALEASALARVATDPAARKAHLERAISLHSDYLEARILLGEQFLEDRLPREAAEVLAAARGRGPLYRRAYFALGLAYLGAGEPRSAFEVFRNLAETGESRAAAHNNLGVALMKLDRISEAIEAFEEAREAGCEWKSCRFNRAWAHWRAGEGALAYELLEELAAEDPIDAEVHFLLASAAFSQARPEVAERSRSTALVLAPYLEGVDAGTVSSWERMLPARENGPAAPSLTASADIEEDVFGLMDLLDARELRRRGRTAEAIQILQRSLYRDPNDAGSRRELADIYRERGDLQEALSELTILLWAEPSAEAHLWLARVYLEMEEKAKAVEELEKALALDPEHPEARGLRSEIAPPLTLR
jgi:tetratricopeptide (TPR) repeat protein/TolB-like protein